MSTAPSHTRELDFSIIHFKGRYATVRSPLSLKSENPDSYFILLILVCFSFCSYIIPFLFIIHILVIKQAWLCLIWPCFINICNNIYNIP